MEIRGGGENLCFFFLRCVFLTFQVSSLATHEGTNLACKKEFPYCEEMLTA